MDVEEGGLEFTDKFRKCFENIKHTGTFAAILRVQQYVNPGLEIKNVGTIGLSLSTRDAEAIAAVCKQSPFGRKDETVVDESVRKTWELDDTEFQCNNPAWMGYVLALSDNLTQSVGVQIAVDVRPYKLLLYEQGAFFKAHRDTEKIPGMFGTLVVCLPSLHTGREVRLVHDGKERVIETESTSAFDLSALAWYSDVQHETRPVTSGHRLVLTYNLAQDQTLPRQCADNLSHDANKVEIMLQAWKNNLSVADYLVSPLQHRYTQNSLCLANLKGQDAAKCRVLDRTCSQNGFWWFLSFLDSEQQDFED